MASAQRWSDRPSVEPYKNVKELVAYAKANPQGQLRSPASAAPSISGELFNAMAKAGHGARALQGQRAGLTDLVAARST